MLIQSLIKYFIINYPIFYVEGVTTAGAMGTGLAYAAAVR
jgi:hypothetical protein